MPKVYHRTREESAAAISSVGFRDSGFNAFDANSPVRGVYVCTDPATKNHRPSDPALFVIDVPPNVLAASMSGTCPPRATDYLIPAALLNQCEVRRA